MTPWRTSPIAERLPDGWRLLDDAELMQLPDPEFFIDWILPAKSVGVLYGPSGAAKTTLVAGLLTALATGRDWFGHRVLRRGGSIYVATEDVSGFKVRLGWSKWTDERRHRPNGGVDV